MAEAITVGTAWGCTSCGQTGPLLSTPCPQCEGEISPVVLAGRALGVHLYNQGLGAAQSGFHTEAIALLEQAVDAAGPDPGALTLLALLYHQAGRVAEAAAAWAQAGGPATALVPADVAALQAYNRALAAAGAGNWEGVQTELEHALTEGCRLAPAFVLQGLAAWVLGRHDAARQCWQQAIDRDPSAPGLQTCLVAMLEQLVLEAERSVVSAALPVAPRSPAPATRWIPAVLALLVAAGTTGAAYRYADVRVTAAEQRATESARLAEVVNAGRAEAEQAANRSAEAARAAQATAAQAETAARQAAGRESSVLSLLDAVGPTGNAEDLERLTTAVAEAKRLGIPVPEWVERGLTANRVTAAVERYFEGYQAFVASDYARAITAFAASLKLDTEVYCADDAAYLAGRAAQLANQPAQAVAWYERVIAGFPQSLYQDDALYFGAQSAAAAGDRERAAHWYRDLVARFPGSGYDHDAEEALRELAR